LALACDFRLVSETCLYSLPEQRLGQIPGSGGAARLQKMVGITRAKDIVMRSRRIPGRQAYEWGVATDCVADDELEAASDGLAEELRGFPPLAQRSAKKLINDIEDAGLSLAIELEGQCYGRLRSSDDFREGVEAFSPEAQAGISRKMTSGSTTSTSGAVNRGSGAHEPSYTGRAVRRFEDADLLRGHGRFGDDLPVRPDTLHAAILRSPHAHAEILSVDVAGALAVPGVDCVVTSEDARRWTRPFAVAVKTAIGAMVPRHRPGALRRRAGCGGVGAQTAIPPRTHSSRLRSNTGRCRRSWIPRRRPARMRHCSIRRSARM